MGSEPRIRIRLRQVEPVPGTAFAQCSTDRLRLMNDARSDMDAAGVDPELRRTSTGNGAELCK